MLLDDGNVFKCHSRQTAVYHSELGSSLAKLQAAMAKAVRGGYDGKGTRPLADQAALEELLAQVDPAHWILEERVAFQCELALTACRDREGSVACFPLVQTHQHRQVCDWVLFPAPVNHAVDAFARNVAASLLTALDYVGVLSIEFFYGPSGLQVLSLIHISQGIVR